VTIAVAARVVLEPAAQEFADATADPPYLCDLGPEKGPRTIAEVQSGPIDVPAADIEDLTVPGPIGDVAVRIVRPQGVPGRLPVILYIHGAGWVFDNRHTHERLVHELAVRAGAAVVFPDYHLTEARYPVPIEENYAVLSWVRDHGAEKDLDGSRIAVAGDSVGGNMTAALTLLAKERSGPELVAQVLFYPVTDASCDTDSYHEFATGYFLRRDAMQWFWDQYLSDETQRDEITASPLRASVEQLAGLPRALVITGEADVVRDEGEAYASKLRQAGVDVTATRYEGIIHDFVMLNALRGTKAAEAAIAQAVRYLSKALTSPYPTDGSQATGITTSPLRAGVEQLAGPPFLLSGEVDLLDNEGETKPLDTKS
jgi:acetyl esterase/lipase